MSNPVKVSTMIEVLSCATATHMVDSKFESSGGIFLVAPPGQLKTAMLLSVSNQPGVRVLSDLTAKNWPGLRDQIAAGRVHTLVFTDFQKIFERKNESAMNTMGILRSMVEEGYGSTGFESRVASELPVKATILGALTTSFLKRHIESWADNGFARRFLFPTYTLGARGHSQVIGAIREDEPIKLNGVSVFPTGGKASISMESLEDKEVDILHGYANMQYGDETTFILLKKIMAVMRWRRKQMHTKDDSFDVMLNFCQAFTERGTRLEIDI